MAKIYLLIALLLQVAIIVVLTEDANFQENKSGFGLVVGILPRKFKLGASAKRETLISPTPNFAYVAKAVLKAQVLKETDPGARNGRHHLGTITFAQEKGKKLVTVRGKLKGLTPGPHGFHIHTLGNLENGCTELTGGHFNPQNKSHGAKWDFERHVGDLGNIEAGPYGVAWIHFQDSVIQLLGTHSIIGRTLVVTQDEDDLGLGGDAESKTTGNSGAPIACGVIGIASMDFSYLNTDAIKKAMERKTASSQNAASTPGLTTLPEWQPSVESESAAVTTQSPTNQLINTTLAKFPMKSKDKTSTITTLVPQTNTSETEPMLQQKQAQETQRSRSTPPTTSKMEEEASTRTTTSLKATKAIMTTTTTANIKVTSDGHTKKPQATPTKITKFASATRTPLQQSQNLSTKSTDDTVTITATDVATIRGQTQQTAEPSKDNSTSTNTHKPSAEKQLSQKTDHAISSSGVSRSTNMTAVSPSTSTTVTNRSNKRPTEQYTEQSVNIGTSAGQEPSTQEQPLIKTQEATPPTTTATRTERQKEQPSEPSAKTRAPTTGPGPQEQQSKTHGREPDDKSSIPTTTISAVISEPTTVQKEQSSEPSVQRTTLSTAGSTAKQRQATIKCEDANVTSAVNIVSKTAGISSVSKTTVMPDIKQTETDHIATGSTRPTAKQPDGENTTDAPPVTSQARTEKTLEPSVKPNTKGSTIEAPELPTNSNTPIAQQPSATVKPHGATSSASKMLTQVITAKTRTTAIPTTKSTILHLAASNGPATKQPVLQPKNEITTTVPPVTDQTTEQSHESPITVLPSFTLQPKQPPWTQDQQPAYKPWVYSHSYTPGPWSQQGWDLYNEQPAYEMWANYDQQPSYDRSYSYGEGFIAAGPEWPGQQPRYEYPPQSGIPYGAGSSWGIQGPTAFISKFYRTSAKRRIAADKPEQTLGPQVDREKPSTSPTTSKTKGKSSKPQTVKTAAPDAATTSSETTVKQHTVQAKDERTTAIPLVTDQMLTDQQQKSLQPTVPQQVTTTGIPSTKQSSLEPKDTRKITTTAQPFTAQILTQETMESSGTPVMPTPPSSTQETKQEKPSLESKDTHKITTTAQPSTAQILTEETMESSRTPVMPTTPTIAPSSTQETNQEQPSLESKDTRKITTTAQPSTAQILTEETMESSGTPVMPTTPTIAPSSTQETKQVPLHPYGQQGRAHPEIT